jgi:Sigma-54 interaction domain
MLDGLHRLGVADLVTGLPSAGSFGGCFVRRMASAVPLEHKLFLQATSLDESSYRKSFPGVPTPALQALFGAALPRLGLFSLADHGTIFLDEISELPLQLQAKLLRVLEDGFMRAVGSVHEHRQRESSTSPLSRSSYLLGSDWKPPSLTDICVRRIDWFVRMLCSSMFELLFLFHIYFNRDFAAGQFG